MPNSAPLPAPSDVSAAYHEALDPVQRSTLVAWLAFTATFGGVRGLTYSIRSGRGPFHNLSLGGEHLHHYMWGILMLTGVGGIALRGEDRRRRHPLVAAAYGSGLALIVDEFALLLDLRDVYWAKQGRVSVDLAVGLIASTGSYVAGLPLLRRLHEWRRHPEARPSQA